MIPPSSRYRSGIAFGAALGAIIFGLAHFGKKEHVTVAVWPPDSGTVAVAESPRAIPSTEVPGARSGRPWEDMASWDQWPPREQLIRLLSKPFGLTSHGRVEQLELAKDELLVPIGPPRLKRFPPQADAEALLQKAEEWQTVSGVMPQLVFYPSGMEHTDRNRRVLNGRLLLHTTSAPDAIVAATAAGCEKVEAMAGLAGYVVAEDRRMPGSSLLAAAALSKVAGIEFALPMVGVRLVKTAIPDDPTADPKFSLQWHLKNPRLIASLRVDANLFPTNAQPVWSEVQGRGVVIGIVDDGVEFSHPDLSARYLPQWSRDFLEPGINPGAPSGGPRYESDRHATAVAGLAAAVGGNGLGVAGVAPQASIASVRLVSDSPETYTTEEMEMEALNFANDAIDIKNNSWGQALEPWRLGVLSAGLQDALKTAVIDGRGGKGTILTFASGNDYFMPEYGYQEFAQGNKAGFANSIYTFAVGAVSAGGVRAKYSETGSHLLTCAPSNGGDDDFFNPWMVTCDRVGSKGYNGNDRTLPFDLPDTAYTNHFSGTSASAAVASGVIALMLEANPDLGWRDVKEILLRSGTKVEPALSDWVSRSGGKPTLPAIKHNHQYGGGLVNAATAVALAKTWFNLGEMSTLGRTFKGSVTVPDASSVGATITHDFSTSPPMRVEQVEVVVDMHHEFRGDVGIDLVSPSGVVSHLANSTSLDGGYDSEDGDRGYRGWTFTSARHWGENSTGIWKVVFKDQLTNDQGTVTGLTIRLHGVAAPPVLIVGPPQDVIVPINDHATLTAAVSGLPDFSYQWLKGTAKITGATSASWSIAKMSTSTAGQYWLQVTNLTGKQACSVNVGAVDATPRTLTVNAGATLVLQATAAGPGIHYQWHKNGTEMQDASPRITGTGTSKLTVKGVTTEDVDSYACAVTVGTASATTGAFLVQMRVKPQVAEDLDFLPTIVSDSLTLGVSIVPTAAGVDGLPTRYTISGLPSGLAYNSVTGVITGRPNVAGTFIIRITASNAAGYGTTVLRTLVIAKLEPTTTGSFNGLVTPHSEANGGFGGTVRVVVAGTGTFSGRLTLGSAIYALTGRMNATPDTDPQATITLKRPGKASPLKVSFSISRADGHLTGVVEETAQAFSTSLEAWQSPYSSINTAGKLATAYNAWFDPPADEAVPQGTSFTILRVNALGAVTWIGRMADHTLMTQTTGMGAGGKVPLHNMIYGNTGSAQGWIQLAARSLPQLNTLTGTMRWVKNPQAASSSTRSYRGGFAAPGLNVTGGQYAQPKAGTVLWGMSGASTTKLMFTGGGIESSASYSDLEGRAMRVQLSHAVQSLLAKPTVLNMRFYGTTGVFTGSAT
ncbi:MAG: propanediol utilization protein, partial [Verrucomicrobiaceae bacterium]|nr:propanediol utilization protein [Verrucomicrobiaceae bacterium]